DTMISEDQQVGRTLHRRPVEAGVPRDCRDCIPDLSRDRPHVFGRSHSDFQAGGAEAIEASGMDRLNDEANAHICGSPVCTLVRNAAMATVGMKAAKFEPPST